MAKWNDKNGGGLDGGRIAVTFLNKDGEPIRVSTNNMPSKYIDKVPFGKIHGILVSYLADDALVSLPEGVD